MGCDTYTVQGNYGSWRECSVRFSEADDGPCLCTLASNYTTVKDFDADTIRSMAMLGAAVALMHDGKLGDDGYVYLPYSLPQHILDAIDKILPSMETRE